MKLKKLKLSDFLTKELLVLYLLLIIGSFLRLQGVFSNSFAFTYDVGRDMLALWNIVYDHKIPLIGATTGLAGVFYGPWWYYFLTPFFVIFRGDPQGIAFLMSVIGVLSIVLSYILGVKLAGKPLGLIFAAFTSISPVLISLSAQIWNPNIAPLFVMILLYLLYKIYSAKQKTGGRYYLLLGVLVGINIDLEIVYGIMLMLGTVVSLGIIKNKNIGLKNFLLLVIGGLFIASPRIIFDLRHDFLMTNSLIRFLIEGKSSGGLNEIIAVFLNRVSILFDFFNSTIALENKTIGAILLLFIILPIVFFYKKSEDIIKKFILTISIMLLFFLFGTTFFSYDIWPHYLVGVPVLFLLILSISIYLIGKYSKLYFAPIIIVVILFYLNLNPITLLKDLSKPLWVGDASVYRNQKEVIDYVYSQAKGKDFKYVVYTPPVYDYPYQYMFKWYGPRKYNYGPQVQSDLAFFILEPDTQYPERLYNWLIERKDDGKVIRVKELKSGIIIQERTN